MGKQRICPRSLIFACIKKRQKIMAPCFLTFYDPGQIEPATVFLLRLGCTHFAWNSYTAAQMFSTTVHLYTVYCTHQIWRQPGFRRWRILTNESTSRITFMNRVDQSQGLKSARTPDRQTPAESVTL
jgi:hypothetical protein